MTIEQAFQAAYDAIRAKQDELVRQGKDEMKMELATAYFDWAGKLEAARNAVLNEAGRHGITLRR